MLDLGDLQRGQVDVVVDPEGRDQQTVEVRILRGEVGVELRDLGKPRVGVQPRGLLLRSLLLGRRSPRGGRLRPLVSTPRPLGLPLRRHMRPLRRGLLLSTPLLSLLRLILQFSEESAALCHHNPHTVFPDPGTASAYLHVVALLPFTDTMKTPPHATNFRTPREHKGKPQSITTDDAEPRKGSKSKIFPSDPQFERLGELDTGTAGLPVTHGDVDGGPQRLHRQPGSTRRLGVSDPESTSPTRTTSAAVVSAPRGRRLRIRKSGVKKLDLSAAKKTSVLTSTCQVGDLPSRSSTTTRRADRSNS
ncbi:hypothetical protein ACFQ9X_20135 [Catenulispora yoronensis]